jgi:8-oxo-dGTP pyrophosphatase MutT (NUDIX family)
LIPFLSKEKWLIEQTLFPQEKSMNIPPVKKGLEWTPLARKNVFSTRVFEIHELKSLSPENTENSFFTLHANDWVIVVPLLKDENGTESFLMVQQWRHGAGEMSIEFPGGVIDAGETPKQAAERELHEETGYKAGKITLAASLSPNPAIMDNKCHIFFAEDLINTQQTDLDDDEFLSAESVPVQIVLENMGKGAYLHGLMSAALFLYVQKKGCPQAKAFQDNPI